MNALEGLTTTLHQIFGGDFPDDPLKVHQAMARAILIYLTVLALIRVGKSRSIGRISPIDVLLGFILGSLASRGITGHASLSGTIASSAALVATHWLLTRIACQSHWIGNLIKGRSHVVVENGKTIPASMLRHHISIHDLEEAMRIKGYDDLTTVRHAYKERNGEISVLTQKEPPRIIEVAVNAGVQTVRIQLE